MAHRRNGGYALGFATRSLRDVASRQGFCLYRCIYSEKEQRQLVSDLIIPFVAGSVAAYPAHGLPDYKVHLIAEKFVDHLLAVAPLLKHQAFSEEREWRLGSGPLSFGSEQMAYRPTSGGLVVPYF